jgi:hypothetical protein
MAALAFQRGLSMNYQNKQLGTAFLIFMGTVMLFIGLMAFSEGKEGIILPAFVPLAVVSLLFSSLNISVNESDVKWSFGPNFWKKSISLSNVNSVKIINTKWYYGLGIRLISTGWLYAVSGLQAVELTLNDGTKVNLGTNEPNELARVITEKLTSP